MIASGTSIARKVSYGKTVFVEPVVSQLKIDGIGRARSVCVAGSRTAPASTAPSPTATTWIVRRAVSRPLTSGSALTVCDVALVAGEFDAHMRAVRAWSATVWDAWATHHASIAAFVEQRLGAAAV